MAFFSKKSKPKNVCVLLDSANSRVLARGSMEGPPDGMNIQINIFEGSPQDVIQYKGSQLVLEPLRDLVGNQVRENLRMPVDFETYVYPTDGREGRWTARANDLSCGGISFYSDGKFYVEEQVQVVIPITRTAPLLLTCQVLRQKDENGSTFYAAKFLDILNEQESMIREAVFNVQLLARRRSA